MNSISLYGAQSVKDQADTSLDDYLAFVNNQARFHRRQAVKFHNEPSRHQKHIETAETFESLAEYIQKQDKALKAAEAVLMVTGSADSDRKPQQFRLSLTPNDIDGLPEELLGELSFSSADRNEFAIMKLLDDAPYKVMSLDQIIVGLYRLTGEINKRQTITSRLYRMGQKNLVFNVPGKKGVYSLEPMSREEAEQLFGDAQDEE